MCKLMITAGIKTENVENAWKFTVAMGEEMSKTDKDGLGYAALTADGHMFGERWLHNNQAFRVRKPVTDMDKGIIESFGGALYKEESYNKFGSISEPNVSAIILHARFATASKHFMNTHPFVAEGTALIHNGVIYNAKKLEMKQSTCDSETILNEYLRYGVNEDPSKIQTAVSKLDGYYACGVLSKDVNGVYYVDVFKDRQANLTAFYIKEVGLVFATSEENVVKVCELLKFTILSSFEVRSGHLMRMNAVTGECMLTQKFVAEMGGGKFRSKKDESVEELEDWSRDASGFYRRNFR